MSREIVKSFCDFVWMKVVRDAANRDEVDKIVGTEIERLLADEREPMECEHPKACWKSAQPATFETVDDLRDDKPITQEIAPHCSACAERERVREMCAGAACCLCEEGIPLHKDGLHHRSEDGSPTFTVCGSIKIRELDLTKLDESGEEKVNG